ncbi:hypothetical protein [Accumulibacter sp.]|uniref:hypothetical protein n=1 Tax=Accumulibacter sp. TaxID=2053492 RepID=UPI0025DB6DB4|nr:hypothetical protein [Accumulibacter sp.]MCM8594003.1 hypothetical protein [Accumulibacter sp.]MCM8624820.1 hypothetical protein [Accumulibacter sp.]MDS4048145.1 hypothetical protein [Accumulibacter sp.]
MSPAESKANSKAIAAAARELEVRRKAATAAASPPAKAVSCTVRLTTREAKQLVRLRKRLASRGVAAGKGQLLRAGLLLLANLDRAELKAAIRDVIAPEANTRS